MVLTKYPKAIVEWATDPRTGIQATEKFASFPPNSGEVKAFCDAEVKRIYEAGKPAPRFRKHEYLQAERYPGYRANVLVRADAPQFPKVKAWSETAEADPFDWRLDSVGIWVALSVYDAIIGGRIIAGKDWQEVSAAAVRAKIAADEAAARAQRDVG
jgi:hypothetical protein